MGVTTCKALRPVGRELKAAGPHLGGFFFCGGKLRTPSKGLPYTDRVSSWTFCFHPTQKVACKTFKETNHTGALVSIVMIYYGINTLFSLKLPPRSLLHNDDLYTIFNSSYTVNRSLTLCMDGFKNGLKAFVSLNRDWLEGTELKLQVSVSEYQVSKTSLYSSPI